MSAICVEKTSDEIKFLNCESQFVTELRRSKNENKNEWSRVRAKSQQRVVAIYQWLVPEKIWEKHNGKCDRNRMSERNMRRGRLREKSNSLALHAANQCIDLAICVCVSWKE